MDAVQQAPATTDRDESWDDLVRSLLIERFGNDHTARHSPSATPAGRSRRIAGDRR